MRGIGIICEYNPFHKGHAYQIAALREREPGAAVICVMSGAFVQRGEPALCSPYARAEAAVLCGADLVLSLPFPWSCAPAELFARAGVSVLAAVGAEGLCFGTEGDCLPALREAAVCLDAPETEAAMRAALADPASAALGYPVLRDRVLTTRLGERGAALLRTPNNALAAEYLRACAALAPDMFPIAVPRVGSAHDSAVQTGAEDMKEEKGTKRAEGTGKTGETAAAADGVSADVTSSDGMSAFAVRSLLYAGREAEALSLLPEASAAVLKRELDAGRTVTDTKTAAALLLSRLRTSSAEELSACAGMSGGIAERLIAAAGEAVTLSDLFSRAATKKVTNAHLRRTAWHGFFGIRTDDMRALPPFTVLLAASPRGTEYLHSVKKRLPEGFSLLSVPSSHADAPDAVRRAFQTDHAAASVQAMLYPSPVSPAALIRMKPFFGGGE